MHSTGEATAEFSAPQFSAEASELGEYLKTLTLQQIQDGMKVSEKLAKETKQNIDAWRSDPESALPAASGFVGDMYSGLAVAGWEEQDWDFAQEHLCILSGLYGLLRPADGILPYRLEMGYKLAPGSADNLYQFWSDKLYQCVGGHDLVNVSSVEYAKTITKFLQDETIVTPKFMTYNPETSRPRQVVIHSKIARGAMANWLIKNKVANIEHIKDFDDLGYLHNEELSETSKPVFICQKFQGFGMSIR